MEEAELSRNEKIRMLRTTGLSLRQLGEMFMISRTRADQLTRGIYKSPDNLETRNNKIKSLRESGKTLEVIGQEFGITRERVRQITIGVEVHKPKKVKIGKLPLSLKGRLEQYIIKTDGCWKWTGPKSGKGYGKLAFKGKDYYAHRAMWEVIEGPIPEGMEICHWCDNPECCRPNHIFMATHKENMQDREKKHRGNRKTIR